MSFSTHNNQIKKDTACSAGFVNGFAILSQTPLRRLRLLLMSVMFFGLADRKEV
jgi:hypothetical protein